MLLTSNFYSILYYNSEVWHIPNLKLLSHSGNALKLSQRNPNIYESFIDIHVSCNRATPNAILTHKLYNLEQPRADWIDLNFNQILKTRQRAFKVIKNNNYKVGNILLSSHLSIVNNLIDLNDLNPTINAFKIKYKKILL